MTEDDFRKQEANRVELAQLLLHPTLQAALNILADASAPSIGMETYSNPVIAAAKYHQAAGANSVLDGLTRLTKPPVERKVPRGKQLYSDPNEIPEGLRQD
jgi:hypothetical protein